MGEKNDRECQHMYVIVTLDGTVKACCYNERDANVMTDILNDGSEVKSVPIVTFRDAR
jgi:hypothetical protein